MLVSLIFTGLLLSGGWFSVSRRPAWRFDAELLRVLGVQPWPPELHRLATDDTAERLAAEEQVEHVEADVPPRRAHRDEPAIDAVPERQARAVRAERLQH